ncbi:MAG: cusC [Gemmatimonadetes bacterium]|jgi:multidrug efflux system outer membrane protein|nr:cusC [Gemmatimonadota bacterium]
MRSAALLVAVVGLGGCRIAPRHVRPELPTPIEWPGTDSAVTAGTRAIAVGWREFFADPRLDALVAAALEHNRDLAVAVAQVEEARGVYRIESAARLPTPVVGADAVRTRTSAAASGVPGAGSVTVDRYAVDVGVSGFELDFWGRVRNLSEAARSQFLATVQAQRAFRLSLIREVATAYLASLEASEGIGLAQATLESRREAVRIARVRMDAGLTSALDYYQAESLLSQAEASLAAQRLSLARQTSRLQVLVGGPVAGPLPEGLPLARQASAVSLAAGLPSELLLYRPDIMAAEERLRAAEASVGAARAAFFPSISLTGVLGFASVDLGSLFGSDGLTWSVGPSVSLPILNRGRLRGSQAVAAAREDIAIANYEGTIQDAFREVSDALAGRRHLADQVAAQERVTQAQRQIAGLAQTRYREGVVRYIEVLDAERSLFAAEQQLLQLRRAEAENLVALYVALGGGVIETR